MTVRHKENQLRRSIYDMMNEPGKWLSNSLAKIDQKMSIPDAALNGNNKILIIQNAQINVQNKLVEHGTKALEHVDELVGEMSGNIDVYLKDNLDRGRRLQEILSEIEYKYIMMAMDRADSVAAKAARMIGWNRTTLVEYFKSRAKRVDERQRNRYAECLEIGNDDMNKS